MEPSAGVRVLLHDGPDITAMQDNLRELRRLENRRYSMGPVVMSLCHKFSSLSVDDVILIELFAIAKALLQAPPFFNSIIAFFGQLIGAQIFVSENCQRNYPIG